MPNTPLTVDALSLWPKAELHVHLDGSLRISTLLELARESGQIGVLPSDSEDGLMEALRGVDDSDSLEAYLAWFRYTLPMMQTAPALRRIAYELAEDAHRENVRYIEVRYGPILHVDGGLTLEQVNDAVLDGLGAAERDFGIRTGVIVCALRGQHAESSVRLAELAADYRTKGVVAFDLAGAEAGFPAKHHLQAFYHARNNLLGLTIHAGESWGPDSIRQALFFCSAHRIGHGITLIDDPELTRYHVNHRIPLEICPTSNVQTHVVDGFETHPIGRLVAAGVPVTVNTDNRLFSRTTMTEELWRTHTRCGVPEKALREVTMNGFRYAFLPWDERMELMRQASDDLAAL